MRSLFAFLLLLPWFAPASIGQETTAPTANGGPGNRSVMRVNVTSQSYDFFRPWSKRAPVQRAAIGAVLPGGRILVTGELVADAKDLELETPDGSRKAPATIEVVDYESNLAIVKPDDATFLEGTIPLQVKESKVGDSVQIWQLEKNGALLSTPGVVTSAEVVGYPSDNAAFLIYRITSALQPRPGSFSMPIIQDNGLTGLLQRFNSRTQNADVIPAPVIERFLKTVETKPYAGFPKIGLVFTFLRDPQLRRYAKLPEGRQGIYVSGLLKGRSADAAGMKVGDVLLSVGGQEIDYDGNYNDPRYGKLFLGHLLTTRYGTGDKVPAKVLRDGKEIDLTLTLAHPNASNSIIEPYTVDRAPRFYILGGLVFQELSRQYLKEWGGDWGEKAPQRFVYYDSQQESLFRDDPREKIVILSQVLATPATIGYESIRAVEVKEINGVKLKSLKDIAKAVEQPVDGFHRIKLEEAPGELILDAKEVKAIEPRLQEAYGLPELKQLD